MIPYFSVLRGLLDVAEETIETLYDYGQHKPDCNFLVTSGTCSCGLLAIRARLLEEYDFERTRLKDRFEHDSD